ncbi:acetate/propionate family kinase [Defluviimonas salinarum]|uniref:Acetate kinase n=1 Tax=Defluviimonas salinarum TaxID=2992147 RepID=A0ABT3IXD6_9RHOB|nr:acetate/propionate family kinase [Defluviimonas salinarum]MCW3780093.1 acetate/propionate family kinase [Defluviimonas salinarum]
MENDLILVVNAGSSSIKVALFDGALQTVATGAVTEIGGAARLKIGVERACEAPDHDAALSLLIAGLAEAGHPVARLKAAGHRVVHGGRALTGSVRVTPEVLAAIEACVPLAPLHNPHNLAAIRALGRLAPELPQVACFDTAFHATNPEVALRYALPAEEEAKGIRRYGFHGISYASLTLRLPELLGAPLPGRVLALHLGNGASLAAIRDGRSVATTMGYSPLDGLTMGTRTGAIDGNAVIRLAEDHGIDGAKRLLNNRSGLLGLGGASDMRALHAAGTEEARFAVSHFGYWAVRHAGSMISAMGGLDCVAFTGGIGENDAEARRAICEGLGFMGVALDPAANAAGGARLDRAGSAVPVVIVPAAEERHIAAEVVAVLGGQTTDTKK